MRVEPTGPTLPSCASSHFRSPPSSHLPPPFTSVIPHNGNAAQASARTVVTDSGHSESQLTRAARVHKLYPPRNPVIARSSPRCTLADTASCTAITRHTNQFLRARAAQSAGIAAVIARHAMRCSAVASWSKVRRVEMEAPRLSVLREHSSLGDHERRLHVRLGLFKHSRRHAAHQTAERVAHRCREVV